MNSEPGLDLALEFAAAAVAIAMEPDLASTRRRIAELAVEKLGVRAAALWRVSRDDLRLDLCTDEQLNGVLSRIAVGTDSLARACYAGNANLVVRDYASETRWPAYARQLVGRTEIRSAAGFCLGLGGSPIGALVLYESQAGALTDQRLARAAIFAAHASVALDDANQADRAANLERALGSNRRIGMAIGVLISLHKMTEEQAFDRLRVASQNNHVKLHEVAEDVILTGAVPEWPARAG